jgi:hypothetical protein
MRYMLLIYTDETKDSAATQEENAAIMAAYNAFGEEVRDRIISGEALVPTSSATSVRVRDGEKMITDGPFAETKEQLGGYYLVEAANLDEAIALAAKIPGSQHGTIEVRPIMVFN